MGADKMQGSGEIKGWTYCRGREIAVKRREEGADRAVYYLVALPSRACPIILPSTAPPATNLKYKNRLSIHINIHISQYMDVVLFWSNLGSLKKHWDWELG
jgi:hypothetical protein